VRADVGIIGTQIAAIGDLGGDALKVIEAENLVVAPGFVDPHTHYDAQMRWDPVLDSSSAHGVTTVVVGNCGVGVRPAAREVVMWVLLDHGMPTGLLPGSVPRPGRQVAA
jgi:N-acyl-D-aspartate/D-glutamate deacylase